MGRTIWSHGCSSPSISATAIALTRTLGKPSNLQQDLELNPVVMGREDVAGLRELFSHPRWKLYLKTCRRSAQALVNKLKKEEDVIEIARIQGGLEQLRIIEFLEEDIENLDKLLIRGEEWLAMKKASGDE